MREFISGLKGFLRIPDMEFSLREPDMLFIRQDSPIIASKRWK